MDIGIYFYIVLSEIIKKKIEDKAEITVRYSRDCEVLANKIHVESNCRLSASTIRRLFGFIKGTTSIRTHTLDVIANYIGHASYDDLLNTLDKGEANKPKVIIELIPSTLKSGLRYQYSSKPDTEVSIECLGKSQFKVISSKNSILKQNDIFKTNNISLHHPLFILELEREGKALGKIIEAKISGITSIKKI